MTVKETFTDFENYIWSTSLKISFIMLNVVFGQDKYCSVNCLISVDLFYDSPCRTSFVAVYSMGKWAKMIYQSATSFTTNILSNSIMIMLIQLRQFKMQMQLFMYWNFLKINQSDFSISKESNWLQKSRSCYVSLRYMSTLSAHRYTAYDNFS